MTSMATIMTAQGATGHEHSTSRLVVLWRYRELMWMLAWRDIRVRYKHSILGAAWAVIPPLMMMLVFTFVFGSVTDIDQQKLTGHPNVPYALFAFSGLVPWMFLSNSLSSATISLVANRQLVTKIYFPREVFPLSCLISSFIDFLVSSALLIVLGIGFHFQHQGWSYELHPSILFLPVVVGVQILFMAGMAMILSMANLFYRDVNFLFRAVVQLWMFVTCVVYQLDSATGWKRALIHLNPMTPIIRAYRDCLLFGRWPGDWAFWNAAVVSLLLFVVGWHWFRRREHEFAEYI